MRGEGKLPGANAAPASPVPATAGAPTAGPSVTGSSVTGSSVTGSSVTGSSVTGSSVTGSSVTGSSVTGSSVTGSSTTGPATAGPAGQVPSVAEEPALPVAEPALGVAKPAAGEPPKHAMAPDRIPWLIALAVFAAYVPISVFRYLRFEPTSWDLGIFTEYVKQYADLHAPVVDVRGAGVNLLGDHFHPIVALIAPFFRVFPSPVTLLVAQALLTAVSVVPVSRAAADLLGTGAGRAIGAAYGFSWGLQQLVNFDFHEIAFAVPLLACSLSALVRGRMRAAVWWAMPLVFVKEDQGFTVAGIGIIMAIVYREQIAGLFLAAWGLAWSFLAVSVIIPRLSQAHRYLYWSDGGAVSPVGGHPSAGGFLSQLVAGSPTKLPTLALILLPTAFIALRSPLVLAAVPSLALRFVGTNNSYWGTYWHYNASVMAIVFIAAIDAIARIRTARIAGQGWAVGQGRVGRPGWDAREPGRLGAAVEQHGAAMMLAVAAALAFQFPLSNLWNPQTYAIGPQVAAARAAMAQVPDGAQVATDLDLLAPLAVRTDTYWLGNSATNPATTYVVFDTASTDWQPPPRNVLAFVESLNHGVRYSQVYVNDGVYVFIRADRAPAG